MFMNDWKQTAQRWNLQKSPVFACFKDELKTRKSLKVFFLQPNLQLNILRNVSFYLRWESISKGFLKFCQILQTRINLPPNCDRLHEIRYKTTNIKYNNYSGIPVEMQLLKAIYQVRPESLETFQPFYVSSKVKNENDAIRNRISDFDKRRISQPKNQ